MTALIPIEHNNQRILTTQQLADGYGASERKIVDNFNNNRSRYQEGKHFFYLEGDELRAFKSENENFGFAPNLNRLYLWTERGALLHAKSLNTDTAWEVYGELVETYFKAQAISSPSCIEDVLITALQEMKANREEITRLNGRVDNAAKVVQDIRSHVHYDPHTWREDTNAKIADIAQATGREFRNVRGEIYKELEIRGHCNLENRLKNRQQRAIEAGTSKTEAGKINKLDAIADDGRLREIFCAIVTQWAVQHGIVGVRV